MQGLSALSAQAAISDSKQESTGRSVICIFYFLEIKNRITYTETGRKEIKRKGGLSWLHNRWNPAARVSFRTDRSILEIQFGSEMER
jgi:hypothetical protein